MVLKVQILIVVLPLRSPKQPKKFIDNHEHACVIYLFIRYSSGTVSHVSYGAKLNKILNATPHSVNSGFPSTRINLSPFTKDFRGGEQLNESVD